MNTTLNYLKALLLVILALVTTCAGAFGVICVGLGIFGTAQEQNPAYLLCIPAGIFFGFICVVAIDCLKYFLDKWDGVSNV